MEKSIHAPKKWQPEHMPIGSVIRYETQVGGVKSELTVTVTDLMYNGVDSFIFDSDTQCPIFFDDPESTASANADFVIEVLQRGNGGLPFEKVVTQYRDTIRADYDARFKHGHLHLYKNKHTYVAYDRRGLVNNAIASNPTLLRRYMAINHEFNLTGDFYDQLKDCFEQVGPGGIVWRANKRKLVARLKRLLPHNRVAKKQLLKEERAFEAEMYQRDMETFFEDV